MANQQLVDYIKGQATAGVSEPDIKKILKDAGWPDTEVEEGFKSSKGSSVAGVVTASPIAASQPITAKPIETVKIEPKAELKKDSMSFDFMTNPGGTAGASTGSPKGKEDKPLSVSLDPAPVAKASKLPWIVAGVAIVIAIGVGAYFFMQGGTSSSEVASLNATNAALTSQVATLNSAASVSSADLDAAKADATELLSELSLFTNAGAGTSTSIKFDLKGLIGNAKAQYTLTTARGVVLTVKNSKDLKVDTALKPLIGGTAQLTGTHIVGTYEITAEGLNGAPFETPVVATSTLPASTSTKPAAGTSTTP